MDKELYLIRVIIEYIDDKKEEFKIGKLRLFPISIGTMSTRIGIYDEFVNMSTSSVIIDKDRVDCYTPDFTALYMRIYSGLQSFNIKDVDFRIENIGIEPDTFKKFGNNLDLGVSFTNNPENEIYTRINRVDVLPNQDINITISVTGKDLENYLVAVRKTKSFKDFSCLYINPLYKCIGNDNNTEFVYACDAYTVVQPIVANGSYIKHILEEYGL